MSKGVSDDARGDESALPEPAKKVMRTVTPPFRGRADTEMTTIGIAYFLGLVVLLIPFLPFVAIVWAISKITGGWLGAHRPNDCRVEVLDLVLVAEDSGIVSVRRKSCLLAIRRTASG